MGAQHRLQGRQGRKLEALDPEVIKKTPGPRMSCAFEALCRRRRCFRRLENNGRNKIAPEVRMLACLIQLLERGYRLREFESGI